MHGHKLTNKVDMNPMGEKRFCIKNLIPVIVFLLLDLLKTLAFNWCVRESATSRVTLTFSLMRFACCVYLQLRIFHTEKLIAEMQFF